MHHVVIIVPGLGDDVRHLKWVTKGWNKFGLTTYIHKAPWHKKRESQDVKLERLVRTIDGFTKKGNEVSLIGISAGGSLVLNAYVLRKKTIRKVVIISGRMRDGKATPSLVQSARDFPAFKESVRLAEKNEPKLTASDRKKFLTLYGLKDGIVPISTTPLIGATNKQLLAVGHLLTITAAVTIFRKVLITFLTTP